MMKILFLLLFLFGCSNMDNRAWYKTLLPPNTELKDYTGKEVSAFLNDFDKKYDDFVFLTHPPGFLIGAIFFFEEGFFIEIYVFPGNIQKNDPQPNSFRSINDFYKEKIERINISSKGFDFNLKDIHHYRKRI